MPKTFLYIFFLLACGVLQAQDTAQVITPGRKNNTSAYKKPYLILISADGFRYDYAEKFNAPNLLRLREEGITSQSMIPSYPSVTFPNHYTIATGMYPAHHGIVFNQFYDRERKETYMLHNRKNVEDGSWYGGLPLWVLAEQQGMISASYHFVGTEAAIMQTYPTYMYKFNKNIDIDSRIQALVDWLKLPDEIRPHFITFYMSDVDDAGHKYGPDAIETKNAVLFVDDAIGKLTNRINTLGLPVNYIFLSDHGMTAIDTVTKINVADYIDTTRFVICRGSTGLHLYANNPGDIRDTYDKLKKMATDFTVYLRDEIPSKWHYNKGEDRFSRIGDILVVPHFPTMLNNGSARSIAGTHGFDPAYKDMHATFYAWGPQFKKGKTIPSFENIHIYPVVCRLLGLSYSHQIDGRKGVLKKILR